MQQRAARLSTLAAAHHQRQRRKFFSVQELETYLSSHPPQTNSSCVEALGLLAKHKSSSTMPIVHSVLGRLESQHQFLSAQELGDLCRSIALGRFLPNLPPTVTHQLLTMQGSAHSAASLSNSIWALATLKQTSAACLPVLFQEVLKRDVSTWTSQQISDLCYALCQIKPTPTQLFDHMANSMNLDAFALKDAIRIHFSFALSKQFSLNRRMTTYCLRHAHAIPLLVPQDFTNLCWSFATTTATSTLDPQLVDVLVRVTQQNVHSFSPQLQSTLLYSFAKMPLMSSSQTSLLYPSFVRVLNDPKWDWNALSARDSANSLWALATLWKSSGITTTTSPPPAFLLRQAIFQMEKNLPRYNSRDVSNMLWALSSFPVTHESATWTESLLLRICQRMEKDDKTVGLLWDAQSLSTVIWSFFLLRNQNAMNWDALARVVASKPDAFFSSPHTICTIARAFARGAKSSNRAPVMEKMVKCSLLFPHRFQNRDRIDLLLALVKARHREVAYCAVVLDNTLTPTAVSKCAVEDLVSLLMGLAWMRYDKAQVESWVSAILAQVKATQVAQSTLLPLLWALSCLDLLHHPQVYALFQTAHRPVSHALSARETTQLLQATLAWKLAYPHSGLPPLLHSLSQGRLDKESPYSYSLAHKLVLDELKSQLGGEHPVYGETVVHGLSVDVFIPSLNAVVEVDGVYHYFANQPQEWTGASWFKHRLLTGTGTKVYHVDARRIHQLSHGELKESLNLVVEQIQVNAAVDHK